MPMKKRETPVLYDELRAVETSPINFTIVYLHQIRALQMAKEDMLRMLKEEDSQSVLTKAERQRRTMVTMGELGRYNVVINRLLAGEFDN